MAVSLCAADSPAETAMAETSMTLLQMAKPVSFCSEPGLADRVVASSKIGADLPSINTWKRCEIPAEGHHIESEAPFELAIIQTIAASRSSATAFIIRKSASLRGSHSNGL